MPEKADQKRPSAQESSSAFSAETNPGTSTFSFTDNRPEATTQAKWQAMANTSLQAKQAAQMHALANQQTPPANPKSAGGVIQRKAFIGDNYQVPDVNGLNVQAQAFLNPADTTVRRFKNKEEMNAYAQNPHADNVDHIGLLNNRDWIRVDKFTVLGENHGEQTSVKIVNAIETKRYRHEAFSTYSQEVLGKNPEFNQSLGEKRNTGMDKMGIPQNLREGDHDAEDSIPKMARAIPDILAFRADQGKKGKKRKYKVATTTIPVEGTAFKEDYDIFKLMTRFFLQALHYAKAIHGAGVKNEIFKFYAKFSKDVDLTIDYISPYVDQMRMPDYSKIPEKMLKKMSDAFTKEAHIELGLTKSSLRKENMRQMQEKEVQKGMETSRFTPQSIENDYLRDRSMLNRIQFAKQHNELLFLLGDAHQEKIKPHLPEGTPSMRDNHFVELQKRENFKADKQLPANTNLENVLRVSSMSSWINDESLDGNRLSFNLQSPSEQNIADKLTFEFEGFEEGEVARGQVMKAGSRKFRQIVNAKNTTQQVRNVKVKLVLKETESVIDEKTWIIPPGN